MIQLPEPAAVDDSPLPVAPECEWAVTGEACPRPPARRAYRTGGRDWPAPNAPRWPGLLDVCARHVTEARMRGANLFRLPD